MLAYFFRDKRFLFSHARSGGAGHYGSSKSPYGYNHYARHGYVMSRDPNPVTTITSCGWATPEYGTHELKGIQKTTEVEIMEACDTSTETSSPGWDKADWGDIGRAYTCDRETDDRYGSRDTALPIQKA